MIQGTKQQIFRHSPVTGLSGTVTINTAAERQIFEAWTQPDTSAGLGALTAGISATDTVLSFNPVSGSFQLGFGIAIIGQYPPVVASAQTGLGSCEMVYFSGMGTGNQLVSM